jgi:hypothetical protein
MTMPANPFEVLGLPARRDLDDEQVRAAWRAIAAATHPDRPDGGDLARYTQASAAYAELRTPWGRSEAWADLAEQAWAAGRDAPGGAQAEPDTSPLPAIPALPPGAAPGHPLAAVLHLPSRIRRGRLRRLLIRAAIAAALALAVLQLIPGTPAAPADITGLILWFVLTGRKDLAPPPER